MSPQPNGSAVATVSTVAAANSASGAHGVDGINGNVHATAGEDDTTASAAAAAAAAAATSNPLARLQILDAKTSLQADGVEKVDLVEWGPGKHESGYDTDQTLAPKPRAERLGEPCGCQTPDILLKLQEEGGGNYSLEELIKEHMCCRDDSCVNYAMREECRYNCEAADFCGNKRLQKQEFIPTAVIDAGPKGRGLAVLTDCRKGDFLAEYVGEAISNKSLPKLFRRYQQERRLYIMALDDKTFIDARRKGGVARFINHSCNPNAKVERWKVKGVLRAVVVATADIKKGSEITFDYQWQRQRGRALTKCHCLEPNCRGTLEIRAQTKEEQDKDLGEQGDGVGSEGRWKKGLSIYTKDSLEKEKLQKADETLINKAIRVYSKEHQEYFVGEVTGYDAEKGMHEVLYQEDFVEMWENLYEVDWMVLVEDNLLQSPSAILRKTKPTDTRRSLEKETDSKISLLAGSSKPLKNYVYVSNAVKEALWAKHLVERCERTCNVQIKPTSQSRSSSSLLADFNKEESTERSAALDQSPTGVAWKLTISGGDIFRAHSILTKNIAYVKRLLEEAAQDKGPNSDAPPTPQEQIIYPRLIADAVKRKLPFIREKCRNVTFSFAPSESISKKFSRLILEANAGPELENAKSLVWSTLINLCAEVKTPLTPYEVPHNLGFLGGTLTKDQLALLGIVPMVAKKNGRSDSDVTDPQYNGAFLNSFGTTFKCAVWVQPDEDMGRISSHKVVGDALSTNLRKLYIGCDPKDVAARWSAIKERVQSLERGIRYIHLGEDRVYLPLMLKNGAEFFQYIRSITGSTVTIDNLTEDHLMIDGSGAGAPPIRLPPEVVDLSGREKAELAAEIVRLQIEIYRNHYARKQSWVFGRDWSLFAKADPSSDTVNAHRSVFGKLDEKSANQCCMEIASIVSSMELSKDVGAHAAIILYRYLAVEKIPNMKAREAALACAYIANKAQKENKWRKIDDLLKAGYATFYPETKFDLDREDVQLLLERTIAVESEILQKLEYDVFFKDTRPILATLKASLTEKMEHFTSRVTSLAFSGQVLGAGSELWLKYGVECVLVACASLLGADVEPLVRALSLVPLHVVSAAELLVENTKFGPPTTVPFLKMSRGDAKKLLAPIQVKCGKMPTYGLPPPQAATSNALADSIARENQRQYVIRGIRNSDCRAYILPHLDKILTDSCCSIFIDPGQGMSSDTCDIILTGTWRAVALAEYALYNLVSGIEQANRIAQGYPESSEYNSKIRPGVLSTDGMQTSEGWGGTNHSLAWAHEKGIRLGGKSCVAARVSQTAMGATGLAWWIPKRVVTGQSGTVSSCLLGQTGSQNHSQQLASFASAYLGNLDAYPILSALTVGAKKEAQDQKSFVAVSLQRWPPEKVSQDEDKKASKSKKNIPVGFSPAALQEMQLLVRLHSSIGSSRGHPNFVLPVGVALPTEADTKKESHKKDEEEDPMFSLFKSTEENESALQKDKKVKESSQIVFDPCPFVLPRFISRKKGADDLLSYPSVVTAWFRDLLTALAHCHQHNVILRSLLPDQIVIDSSGVAKLGGLYRCTIQKKDKHCLFSALELAKRAKKKKQYNEEELSITPTTAPELLWGCPRHGKETDVWMLGCLLAHILLGKPLFTGKDRESLLTSQYKVVGTPGKDNYPKAVEFPGYEKPYKKYKRGVAKFFAHALKDKAMHDYEPHIDLVANLLHLDPAQRLTAEQSLQHPCVTRAVDETTERATYAAEWNGLQNKLWDSQTASRSSAVSAQNHQKRKALLLSAVGSGSKSGGGGDDLYDDLEDFLQPSFKKPRN